MSRGNCYFSCYNRYMQRIIGAHLSISKGYNSALESIIEKGGNALQIFSTSPRSWSSATVPESIAASFVSKQQELGISHVFFHASYLVNLADNGYIGEKSRAALISELRLQPQMNVKGSVVHVGSYKNNKKAGLFDESEQEVKYQVVLTNIREILAETPEDSFFLIENDATRKVCQNLETIARIIEDIDSPRLKVCLDTCHLHAGGYAMKDKDEFNGLIEKFDRLIGLDRLAVVHLNDSKDPFASGRDRHDNLGEGSVGEDVFIHWLNHQKTRHLPFILETPGFDGNGPDAQNIERAKSYIVS